MDKLSGDKSWLHGSKWEPLSEWHPKTSQQTLWLGSTSNLRGQPTVTINSTHGLTRRRKQSELGRANEVAARLWQGLPGSFLVSIQMPTCLKCIGGRQIGLMWLAIYSAYRNIDSCRLCHLRIKRFQKSFWIFFGFLSWYHLPCSCNSLELESVILHGICHILAWLLCILHGICYIWAWLLCILHGICYMWPMFAFHFAWYVQRFGTSISHLHGICYILVLQTLMWVSWELL